MQKFSGYFLTPKFYSNEWILLPKDKTFSLKQKTLKNRMLKIHIQKGYGAFSPKKKLQPIFF